MSWNKAREWTSALFRRNVNMYVKTKYKDDKIVKYYKVKDAKGKTVWRGKVEQGYVLFDENGNYIKMEKD
jgi:hypothetical protein